MTGITSRSRTQVTSAVPSRPTTLPSPSSQACLSLPLLPPPSSRHQSPLQLALSSPPSPLRLLALPSPAPLKDHLSPPRPQEVGSHHPSKPIPSLLSHRFPSRQGSPCRQEMHRPQQ